MTRFTRAIRVVAAIVALAAAAISASQQQPPPPLPDVASDLRQRHPEISAHPEFQKWLSSDGGIGPWYETAATSDQIRTVVIQNGAGTRVFGAEVAMAGTAAVRRVAAVDLAAIGQTRADAQRASANLWSSPQIRSRRPVIDFLPDGQVRAAWEYEVARGNKIETYRLQDRNFQLRSSRDRLQRSGAGGAPSPSARSGNRVSLARRGATHALMATTAAAGGPVPGDSADDDLHVRQSFAGEAQAWVTGLATVEARARRINEQVFATYSYNANIVHISEFTWADFLTRDENGRAGICDELAVVAVTYLRSIGIPSRVKLIVWTNPQGKTEAHAAVEYFDDGHWFHMDPTWNRFHDPGAYRAAGNTNVLVMDTFDPLDSRSNADAFGVPDPPDDHQLHPYFDYVIPAYPGIAEPGYSF